MMIASSLIFFINDTATTEIYTLSLHDALPISIYTEEELRQLIDMSHKSGHLEAGEQHLINRVFDFHEARSEEHTSELQSRQYLVCRLLLEKKKNYHTVSVPAQAARQQYLATLP